MDSWFDNPIKLLDALGKCTEDYLYIWNIEENRVWFSEAVAQRYALGDGEFSYCTKEAILKITHPNDHKLLKQWVREIAFVESDKVPDAQWRWIDKNGKAIWLSVKGQMQVEKAKRQHLVIGTLSDAALKSKVDFLTGRFNKIKMAEDLTEYLETENSGYLMLLDIDDLKNINLRYGREHGDKLIVQMAELLEDIMGNSLQIYRLEGDRFALHLPKYDKEKTVGIYQEIKKCLPQEFTVSVGIASYEEAITKDFSLVCQYAEDALEKAKRNGRNTFAFFAEDDRKRKITEVELFEELKASVADGCTGFYMMYQPQVEAKGYRIYGAEALLRYRSVKRGIVFPDQFIPLLEESGLLCHVGLWAIENALKACKRWRCYKEDFRISVNISYMQLKQVGIVDKVLELLEKMQLPGEALTLEVTESMQLQNFRYYNEIFRRWKSAGIAISVDDFGIGYSSLAYLKNLKIDEIKVERCFVSGIQFSSYNCRLLKNVLELAHSAGIRVCCEGVESKGEMKVLAGLQVNLLQGYLFAKPSEENLFEEEYIKTDIPEYYNRLQIVEMNRLQEIKKQKENETHLDDFTDFHYEDILKATDMGLWVIRIDTENNKYEMFADETMRRILAVDDRLTPEECYKHWYGRISDGYYDYVNRNVEKMIEKRAVVQLQYTWDNPLLGEVTARCTGTRVADVGGMICLEGYHRMVEDLDETSLLQDKPSKETFEYNQAKNSIYFHTERRLINGEEIKETDFPNCWIEKGIVHPHFVNRFAELFTDVQYQEDVTDYELMLKSKQGEYEWFRVNIRHLGEERDRNTVFVQLNAANQERRMELENVRIRDFYHASLSETIAYAEMDLESGQILETGGMWKEFMSVEAEQIDKYLRHTDFKAMVQSGDMTHRVTFEHDYSGVMKWTELVIHIFAEQYSENMYALIYLKDVDMQMRKEIAQRKEAELDPLTRVYNRKAFREQVETYLKENIGTGVLVIVDIDNFKLFNDRYGHLTGDAVLKRVADSLQKEFEAEHVVGRFGGDEFMVFVKADLSKEILSEIMDRIYCSLEQEGEIPISCSAGLLCLTEKEWSYEEMLEEVDIALYKSKENGKHQYSFV